MPPKKYYGIKVGRNPGVYNRWDLAEAQISEFPGAVFKGFETMEEAKRFIGTKILTTPGVIIAPDYGNSRGFSSTQNADKVGIKQRPIYKSNSTNKKDVKSKKKIIDLPLADEEKVIIRRKGYALFETYTDGSWKMKDLAKNKKDRGPGGWAYIILREMSPYGIIEYCSSGSSSSTTNVEMEHHAMLNALKELRGKVNNKSAYHILYSDNSQVLKSLSRGSNSIFDSSNPRLDGWIVGWKKKIVLGNNLESVWQTSQNVPVEYQKEVTEMEIEVSRIIKEGGVVRFMHVSAHSGIEYNEKVDALAKASYEEEE